jgi:hypothetical protein
MPILGIKNKQSLAKRLNKFVDCNLFYKYIDKEAGNMTYFSINKDVYTTLISDTGVSTQKCKGINSKVDTYQPKSLNIYSSINNSSINKKNIYPQEILSLTNFWLERYKNEKWFKVVKDIEKYKEDCNDSFDKLIRLDKFTSKQIEKVIRALFDEQGQFYQFWIEQGNIRSPKKFRQKMKQKDITYFEWFLFKLPKEEEKQMLKYL